MSAEIAGGPDFALRFDAASLVYDDGTEALASIDLAVSHGQIVSVIGPSGCGKSTLLRLASGLAEPTGGTVDVDRTNVGYVFQDATLLPWRTVRANVGLLAELRNVPASEVHDRVDRALALTGLDEFAAHHPSQLSGGMRMRTSVARALVLEPELVLFDEPFGALDEFSRHRLNEALLEIVQLRKLSGLFVTHSIDEAIFLGDRVDVMSARPGRIVRSIDVPFPHPRKPEIRFDPTFASIAAELSGTLREAQ